MTVHLHRFKMLQVKENKNYEHFKSRLSLSEFRFIQQCLISASVGLTICDVNLNKVI